MLEQLRQERRERYAGIISQVPDQAARRHVGARLMEDMAGAGDIDVGLRNFDVVVRPTVARLGPETPVRLVAVLVVIADFGSRGGVGEEARRHARFRIGKQDDRAERGPSQRNVGDLHPRVQRQHDRIGGVLATEIGLIQVRSHQGGVLLGGLVGDLGLLGQVGLIDVRKVEEAVRRPKTLLAPDEDRQARGLERLDDRLGPAAPELGQSLRIEQYVGHLAEQIALDAPAGGRVARHADQGEAGVVHVRPGPLDAVAELIVLEVAVQGGLGDVALLLLVGDPGQLAGVLQVDLALTQRLQRLGVKPSQRRQTPDLQLVVAERAGDCARVHLRLAHLADGHDHIGDVDRPALGIGQHGRGRLGGLGLEDVAADRMGRIDPASLEQQLQAEQTAAAIEGHVGLLALAARPHAQRDDHVGDGDGFRELRNALVGGLLGADVLRRDADVVERNNGLDRGRRASGGVGHWIRVQRRGRGSSCP